jgi:starch synthase
LGSGEERYVRALEELARRYPAKFAVKIAYDDRLAHVIEAGADLFLMPSRFEPCGLNQLYSFRYGTVPIVRATGGLDDTVTDFDERSRTGTGFKFDDYAATALVAAVKRAVKAFSNREAWNDLVARIMRLDYSWDASARRYAELYRQLRSPRKDVGDANAKLPVDVHELPPGERPSA